MNNIAAARAPAPVKTSIPWVIVSGSFHFAAGQAKAVAWLADYLARGGTSVHLVGNAFDPRLAGRAHLTMHQVPRMRGTDAAGNLFLGRAGLAVIQRVLQDQPHSRVVVNGG